MRYSVSTLLSLCLTQAAFADQLPARATLVTTFDMKTDSGKFLRTIYYGGGPYVGNICRSGRKDSDRVQVRLLLKSDPSTIAKTILIPVGGCVKVSAYAISAWASMKAGSSQPNAKTILTLRQIEPLK